MKRKKLYLFFTLTIAVGTLLIFVNDLKKPKSVEAQGSCVQIGSTVCEWIQQGQWITNSDHLMELKCDADEYVGSVIYRTGGKMDSDDMQIKCCKFLVTAPD